MLAEDGVGAPPGVALRTRGRGDDSPCTSSTPAEGGMGGGEVISIGRGLLTLENCSEVLAVTRINTAIRNMQCHFINKDDQTLISMQPVVTPTSKQLR